MDSTIEKDLPWWHENAGFFGALYKEADDSFENFFEGEIELNERTTKEIDGVIRLCQLNTGDSVIDCPTGYGRHSVELATRKLNVTGLDINDEFLALAKQRAQINGVHVNYLKADMREIPSLPPVNAVINMFYSFGFFNDEENERVAQEFYKALKPGGKFLMHTMVTVPAFGDGRIPLEERRQLKSGGTLVSRRRLNPATKREEGIWSILDENKTERELTPYDVRIYTANEFRELCLNIGFKDVKLYGDWDGSEYKDESPYLIVVAEK